MDQGESSVEPKHMIHLKGVLAGSVVERVIPARQRVTVMF